MPSIPGNPTPPIENKDINFDEFNFDEDSLAGIEEVADQLNSKVAEVIKDVGNVVVGDFESLDNHKPAKAIPLTEYCKSHPDIKNADDLLKKQKEGKIFTGFAADLKPGEKERKFYFPPSVSEHAKKFGIEVGELNDKKELVIIKLAPHEMKVIAYTAEQMEKINNIALNAFGEMAKAYAAHKAKMEKAEEKGESPLMGRVTVQIEDPGKFIKQAMKDLTNQNLSALRKRDQRMQEIRDEEQAQIERDTIKRKTAELDKKFDVKMDHVKRDDQIKSEEKKVA
jgi:hypothetical protein